jgi:hypothetical protein
MIVLSNSGKSLRIVLTSPTSTNRLHAVANWRDITGLRAYSAGDAQLRIDQAGSHVLVAGPPIGTQRLIDYLSIYNDDDIPISVQLVIQSGANGTLVWKDLIPAGKFLHYNDGSGLQVGSMPAGQTTTTTPAPEEPQTEYAVRMDEQSTYTYFGFAEPGSVETDPVWRIKRITNLSLTIQYPDGNANFDNVWQDRASLIYS